MDAKDSLSTPGAPFQFAARTQGQYIRWNCYLLAILILMSWFSYTFVSLRASVSFFPFGLVWLFFMCPGSATFWYHGKQFRLHICLLGLYPLIRGLCVGGLLDDPNAIGGTTPISWKLVGELISVGVPMVLIVLGTLAYGKDYWKPNIVDEKLP